MAFTESTNNFRSIPGPDGRGLHRTVEIPERKMVVIGGKLRERHTYTDGEQQITVFTDRGGSTELTRSIYGGFVLEGKVIHQLSIGANQSEQEGPKILIKAAVREAVAGSGSFWFDGDGGSIEKMRATGPVEIHTPFNSNTGITADHRRFIKAIELDTNGSVSINPVASAPAAEVGRRDIVKTNLEEEPITGLQMSQLPENNQPLPRVTRDGTDEFGREKIVMQGSQLSKLIVEGGKVIDAQEILLISELQVAENSKIIADSVESASIEGDLKLIGTVGTLNVGKTGDADIDTLLVRGYISGSLIADQIDGIIYVGGTEEQPATITYEHMSLHGLAVLRDHVRVTASEGRIVVTGEDVILNGEYVTPGFYHVSKENGMRRIGDIPPAEDGSEYKGGKELVHLPEASREDRWTSIEELDATAAQLARRTVVTDSDKVVEKGGSVRDLATVLAGIKTEDFGNTRLPSANGARSTKGVTTLEVDLGLPFVEPTRQSPVVDLMPEVKIDPDDIILDGEKAQPRDIVKNGRITGVSEVTIETITGRVTMAGTSDSERVTATVGTVEEGEAAAILNQYVDLKIENGRVVVLGDGCSVNGETLKPNVYEVTDGEVKPRSSVNPLLAPNS